VGELTVGGGEWVVGHSCPVYSLKSATNAFFGKSRTNLLSYTNILHF